MAPADIYMAVNFHTHSERYSNEFKPFYSWIEGAVVPQRVPIRKSLYLYVAHVNESGIKLGYAGYLVHNI